MGNRKAAQDTILNWVARVDPSGRNSAIYTAFFEKMSDEDFHNYMLALKEGRDFVSFTMENLNGMGISTENNLKVADEMGVEFFHHLWLTDPITGITYLTPQKYLCIHLPVRRQIQTLVHKISIPEDNKHVDELTDQPTGVSKGSALSFPELLVLYSQGHEDVIKEMMKYRGGDIKGMNVMDRMIRESGGAKMEQLDKLGTHVKSTEVLSTYLTAMHIENNFIDRG